MRYERKIGSAFWALRLGLGATAFLAGADKFTNLLTDWGKYMAPEADQNIPLSRNNFMRAVGVVEMLVGVGILSPRTRLSSYAASAWLLAIAGNLWLDEDYDVAVRDVNMALAAFALGQLSGARDEEVAKAEPAHLQKAA
jgi:uncharacterized membrane protein YphA (DoxX/SURF4 family)